MKTEISNVGKSCMCRAKSRKWQLSGISERDQTAISTGVYAVVRHPGYSSIILWALSIPLLTGAIYTPIPSTVITLLIFIRTYLGDKMLKKELEGYAAYPLYLVEYLFYE
jgi:protein-S-isoprenylcysteine O-methyltransferase Ste14